MPVIKRFLGWIRLKNRLHYADFKPPEFVEGDVWWCSVGENVGGEINGKSEYFSRPVLIFKKLSGNLFLGIPTSTRKQKTKRWYISILINNKIPTSVILSQVRMFDSKRLSTKIGNIDKETYLKTKRALQELFL